MGRGRVIEEVTKQFTFVYAFSLGDFNNGLIGGGVTPEGGAKNWTSNKGNSLLE